MPSYIDIARALPAPTPAQTRAFARFVTGAHSWYKHLRLSTRTPADRKL